jgi:hypothetical protein
MVHQLTAELGGFTYAKATPKSIRVIKSRRMRWRAGHLACMREMRNSYNILVEKPEGKRPIGKTRRRWKDIRMNIDSCMWLRKGTSGGLM